MESQHHEAVDKVLILGGTHFLGIARLQMEASSSAYPFYKKLGYQEMPFDSPDGEPTHPDDQAMGKYL